MTGTAKTTIRAEEIRAGDTILLGGFADQPMPVVRASFAGAKRTRVHVDTRGGISFSYRRSERVTILPRTRPNRSR